MPDMQPPWPDAIEWKVNGSLHRICAGIYAMYQNSQMGVIFDTECNVAYYFDQGSDAMLRNVWITSSEYVPGVVRDIEYYYDGVRITPRSDYCAIDKMWMISNYLGRWVIFRRGPCSDPMIRYIGHKVNNVYG